jgi:hypothetical protein
MSQRVVIGGELAYTCLAQHRALGWRHSLFISLTVGFVLTLLFLPMERAYGAQPEIWDKVIFKQPFDRSPFRQITVPAWVEKTTGCGYTLSGMDSLARAAAVAHGVTISELGFVDPFNAYYDSKLLR